MQPTTVSASLQGKKKTDGVCSSNRLGNPHSLLEMLALHLPCFLLSGTLAEISSYFYHQFSRQFITHVQLTSLWTKCKTRWFNVSCVTMYYITAGSFLKSIWAVYLISLTLHVKVKALKKSSEDFTTGNGNRGEWANKPTSANNW